MLILVTTPSRKRERVVTDTVVVSAQHRESSSLEEVRRALREVAEQVLPPHLVTSQTRFLLNPAGRFVVGGPDADTGVTGRKIMVDTYGGLAHHGGGAFSGKDPSKLMNPVPILHAT